VRAVPSIFGNISLAASPTLTVAAVTGATEVGTLGHSNEQVGLAINANIFGGATLNKAGLGALQLGGVSTSVTTINVDAGSLILGPSTGGGSNYANASVMLDNGTILDMRGQTNTQIGSIYSSDTDPATPPQSSKTST
jgi:hypothetical protein